MRSERWSVRLALAWAALRGRLDWAVEDGAGKLEAQASAARLRAESMERIAKTCIGQANYWFDKYTEMSTKFVTTQNFLCDQIDSWRKKTGAWDGRPFLDGELQKAFAKKFGPESVPAEIEVEGRRIPTTPIKQIPPSKTS